MRTVIGLDLSLTSTGIAVIASDTYHTDRVKAGKDVGHRRLAWISGYITGVATGYEETPLVLVEGPAFGAKGSAYHQLAGLWWIVAHDLWRHEIPYVVVSTTSLKRYATGKGNAGKDDVLREVTRRYELFGGGNDEADALTLAAMGADHLGHPLVVMPETHRTALAGVTWPVVA